MMCLITRFYSPHCHNYKTTAWNNFLDCFKFNLYLYCILKLLMCNYISGIIFCLFAVIANAVLVYVFVALRRKESVTDIIFLQLAALGWSYTEKNLLSLNELQSCLCWSQNFVPPNLIRLKRFFPDCLSGLAGIFGSIFLVNERRWFNDEKSTIGDAICYPAGENDNKSWQNNSLSTLNLYCSFIWILPIMDRTY